METAAPPGGSLPRYLVDLRRREECCLVLADAVICVSDVVAEELRSAHPALPPLRVIPNGIDVERFSGADPGLVAKVRAELAGPCERLVLFAGRCNAGKGLPELIVASSLVRSQVPEARFAFVLANVRETSLEALRSMVILSTHSTFLGNVPRASMPAYYAAADLVGMPSRWEPFGLVALEAMAAARPLVVSDVAPLNRLVTDGVNGRVVSRIEGARGVVDVRELATAITELLRRPAWELEEMGRRGRERVIRDYPIQLMVDRTVAAYEDLLRGGWGCGNGLERPESGIQARAGKLRCPFPEG